MALSKAVISIIPPKVSHQEEIPDETVTYQEIPNKTITLQKIPSRKEVSAKEEEVTHEI